jgi:hypothetical protein
VTGGVNPLANVNELVFQAGSTRVENAQGGIHDFRPNAIATGDGHGDL